MIVVPVSMAVSPPDDKVTFFPLTVIPEMEARA